MAISVSNHGHNTATGGSTIAASVSAAAGDIILIGVVIGATDTNVPAASIAGAGQTWHLISGPAGPGYQNPPATPGFGNFMGVWWAQATGPLSAQTVTVTQTNGTVTMDDASIVYASFTGVQAPIFDTNGSLPAASAYESPNPPLGDITSEAVVSSDFAPDLFFCFYGTNSDTGRAFSVIDLPDTPGLATLVDQANNAGGLNFSYIGLGIAPSTIPESSVTWGCGTTGITHLYVIGALAGAVPPDRPPGPPTNLRCGTGTAGAVTPTWDAPAGTVTSYTLQWRPVGTSSWNVVTGITTTYWVILGLMAGTGYEWQVAALNDAGNSGFTASEVCLTVPATVIPSTAPRLPVFEIPLTGAAQRFGITLAGTEYIMAVAYHDAQGGGWTFDLFDSGGAPLLCGQPLVTGCDLLGQFGYLGIGGQLRCRTDGFPDFAPTYANLGTIGHLYFIPDPAP
jgi:hypothetical protein